MKYILLLFALFSAISGVTGQKHNSPNIVLILADDQGWGSTSVMMDDQDTLSASDFMRTPNLKQLAESGVRFTNGYASHPNCSPTRVSIVTGKTPARLHYTDILGRPGGSTNSGYKMITPHHVNGLDDNELTIAEIIKLNRPEYATAYFGKWHIDKKGPEAHGYDASDGPTGNGEGNRRRPGNPKDIFGVTQRSGDWIEKQVKDNKPFFIQVSHYALHKAVQSRDETKAKYRDRKPGKRHNNINYAAMTEDLDTGVGILLERIKKLGIEKNTYIIYLADNGAFPGLNPGNTNGPLRGWKATLWEGGIRTPFIVAGPDIPVNKVSDVRVVGWDLYPTICEWLNIKNLPEDLDGGSIATVLKNGGKGKIRRTNNFLVFHWPHYVPEKGGSPSSALIKDNFKLFVSYETGERWLYNLDQDRQEEYPVNKKYPKKVKELSKLLSHYLETVDAGMPKPNPAYDAEKDVMLQASQKKTK